jgi:hypothetical protein
VAPLPPSLRGPSRYTEPVGRRESWWANFLMMALGILILAATIGILIAGIANFPPR